MSDFLSKLILTPELFVPGQRPRFSNLYTLDKGHHLAQGLQAWFLFNESAGTTVKDLSGNENNGSFVSMGGEAWIDSPVGPAVDFAASSYIDIGDNIDDLGPLTVMAWINPDTVATGTMSIVAHYNNTYNKGAFSLEINRTASKVAVIWDGTVVLTGSTPLTSNKWHNVAFTRAGSTGSWTAKLYVNGEQDGSNVTSVNPQAPGFAATIGTLATNPLYSFNGQIADVRIYNRALSSSEMRHMYLGFLPLRPVLPWLGIPVSAPAGIPIYLGSNQVQSVYKGSSAVSEIYKGSTRIWP